MTEAIGDRGRWQDSYRSPDKKGAIVAVLGRGEMPRDAGFLGAGAGGGGHGEVSHVVEIEWCQRNASRIRSLMNG